MNNGWELAGLCDTVKTSGAADEKGSCLGTEKGGPSPS